MHRHVVFNLDAATCTTGEKGEFSDILIGALETAFYWPVIVSAGEQGPGCINWEDCLQQPVRHRFTSPEPARPDGTRIKGDGDPPS